jgi:uncharacterized protein YicC (UPF0701 family)
MADRTVGTTAKNLLLALINATLILVIICLWLAWKVLDAAEGVSAQLNQATEAVLPLREDVAALTAEVAGARSDLAELRSAEGAAAAAGLAERLDRIEAQLEAVTGTIARVQADPDALIDRAMTRAFDELRAIVAELVALRGRPTGG